MLRSCKTCGKMKHPMEFHTKQLCNQCRKDYEKNYVATHKKEKKLYDEAYRKNPDKQERIKKNELNKKTSVEKRFSTWKASAKQRGKEWTLVLEDLTSLPLKCFFTGEDLVMEPKQLNSVSIDRIDSNKGYHRDNIVFCSLAINYMKQSYTKEEFYELCEKVVNYKNKQDSTKSKRKIK